MDGLDDLDDSEWQVILDLLRREGGLPDGVLYMDRSVTQDVDETRLRFNSPTPVRFLVIEAELGRPGARRVTVQAEIFHWQVDDEWELVHLEKRARP